MKILVTGGTGYIGSHTVVELQQSGYEVLIVDNLYNSYAWVVDRIEAITGIRPFFEEFDLCDRERTLELFRRHAFGGVIHFAAVKSVSESVEKPLFYYRNNLDSLMNILEAMQQQDCGNLVFSSSCTVYGQPDNLPVTEDTPFGRAWSPYGMTKQISESVIQDVARAGAGPACISLRYFNPIGAHGSALIGELPIGVPGNLVPFITQTAAGKREYLSVYGNDYNTPDGTPIRDYIHVTDLAGAHVRALERLLKGPGGRRFEAFNLGTGKGFSVLEVISSFERVSGRTLNYRIAPRRPGDVEQIWAGTALAEKELNWKAMRDLDDMMLSAWKWEQSL